jgi:GNAT superfamily N-acetyltransferase
MMDKVRKVYYNELNKLLELYKYLNADDPDISADPNTIYLWDDIINDHDYKIFVIEDENQLVASCTLVIMKNLTRGGKPYALIENVVTHGEYRHRGYGKAVLEKAISTAKEEGCYKVMLMTGRKDEGIVAFYEKAGFDRDMKTGFCIKFK